MLRLRFLPEGEICLIMLLTRTVQLTALIDDILQISTGKDAIMVFLVVCFYIKVDTALGFISETVVQYLFHQLLLLHDMPGSVWFDGWWQHIECIHCLMITIGVIRSEERR